MKITTTDQVTRSTTVALAGRLDALTAPSLREALDEVFGDGVHQILIDLAEVDFVDSAGLAALVHAMKAARSEGGDVELVRPRSDDAFRVFELTKFDAVFRIHEAG